MSEPIGWNLYSGNDEDGRWFTEFIPNEEALTLRASAFADEVTEYAGQQPPEEN